MVDKLLRHYFALLERKGIGSLVSVTTPAVLDSSSRTAIKSALQYRLAVQRIDASFEVDPSLVTGFVASNYTRKIESSGHQTLRSLEEI
jgi:F0F1-type ATP synthase delta subunit